MPCQSARSAETPHTAQYMSQTCCVEQRHHMSLEALTSGACAFSSPTEELSSRLDLAAVAFDAVANMALLVDARALAGTWSSTFGTPRSHSRCNRIVMLSCIFPSALCKVYRHRSCTRSARGEAVTASVAVACSDVQACLRIR